MNVVDKIVRLPLRLIPSRTIVRVASGPLRGSRWVTGSATAGAWLGTYEHDKVKRFRSSIRSPGAVWDIGAHAGYYSLLASRLLGASGTVVAFEPLPHNLAYLRQHLELNGVKNVIVVPCAVSDTDGRAHFAAGGSQYGRLDVAGGLEVETVCLDTYLRQNPAQAPTVVKMDVEGAEFAVLRGARTVLATCRPIFFIAGHGWMVTKQCGDLLAEHDYRVEQFAADAQTTGMYELYAEPRERASALS